LFFAFFRRFLISIPATKELLGLFFGARLTEYVVERSDDGDAPMAGVFLKLRRRTSLAGLYKLVRIILQVSHGDYPS